MAQTAHGLDIVKMPRFSVVFFEMTLTGCLTNQYSKHLDKNLINKWCLELKDVKTMKKMNGQIVTSLWKTSICMWIILSVHLNNAICVENFNMHLNNTICVEDCNMPLNNNICVEDCNMNLNNTICEEDCNMHLSNTICVEDCNMYLSNTISMEDCICIWIILTGWTWSLLSVQNWKTASLKPLVFIKEVWWELSNI